MPRRTDTPRRSNAKRKPRVSRRKTKSRYTAATADKYELYQKAVQSPEEDVAFLERMFRRERGRAAHSLREDFCGTALLSSHWIARSPENTAEGYDIDPEPIAWGLEHNFKPLAAKSAKAGRAKVAKPKARTLDDATRERFHFHLKDVRAKSPRPVDLRIAFNFSYWVFKTRRELIEYFESARAGLVDDGVFAIDLYGGWEATQEMSEPRRCGGFTYVWEQKEFWPGTGDYRTAIRFRFPDKTEMEAFRYDWRHWSLTELRDALYDAGFKRVESYLEGSTPKGEGDGVFRRGVRGENCEAWLCYLIAAK